MDNWGAKRFVILGDDLVFHDVKLRRHVQLLNQNGHHVKKDFGYIHVPQEKSG